MCVVVREQGRERRQQRGEVLGVGPIEGDEGAARDGGEWDADLSDPAEACDDG